MLSELLAKEPDACALRSGRWFASLTFVAVIALQASSSGAAVPPVTVAGTTVTSTAVERSTGETAGTAVVDSSAPRAVRVDARAPIVVAQAAAPAATDAATAAATDPAAAPANATQDNGGIPWWVWLLLALIVIGIILWLLSRRKNAAGPTSTRGNDEPIIKTRK